jgi:hypothetical protein
VPFKLTVPMTCARCGAAFLAPKPCPSLGARKYCSNACAWANSAKTLEEKFWPRFAQDAAGCWEWAGARTKAGYGQLHHKGLALYAHRVSWELHYGPIPPNADVCHTCDRPACVRPDHLFVGSHAQNMADSKAKGRNSTIGIGPHIGEAHPGAKLTEADVRAIRARSSERHSAIARDFAVSRPTITAIMTGRNWAHVEHP